MYLDVSNVLYSLMRFMGKEEMQHLLSVIFQLHVHMYIFMLYLSVLLDGAYMWFQIN